MTTGPPSRDDRTGTPPPEEGSLRARFRSPLIPDRVLTELASVKVAQDELRLAEEELRVQQAQITELLLQHEAERRWRGQMSALVPVGLCLTDGHGDLVEANPALTITLGTGPLSLSGTPLTAFLAPADESVFRSELETLSTGRAAEGRMSIVVQPRHSPPVPMIAFGFTERADADPSVARVQWILVPEVAPGSGPTAEPAVLQRTPPSELLALATALSELSRLSVGERDRQRLLSRMATLVRGAVPGAEWVSITLGSPFEPQRLGSDSTEAQDFDGRQVRAGEGPCLDAYDSRSVVLTDDVTTDPRWPTLGRLAAASAVRSVLALPVLEDGTTTGAINVYSRHPGAFGPAERRIAELATAAVASVLQTVAERETAQDLADNLERALKSRASIDQAKGMIMALLGVDADEAFARMVNLSSRLNVKVRDLASQMVEGHVDELLKASDRARTKT